jgi:hypothetical protein
VVEQVQAGTEYAGVDAATTARSGVRYIFTRRHDRTALRLNGATVGQ